MKKVLSLILFFSFAENGNAQLLKKLGDKITRDAEWRIRNKADKQVSKALDSIIEVPKKIIEKKKTKNSSTQADSTLNSQRNTVPTNKSASGKDNRSSDTDDMTPKDGFITLSLSANTAYTGFGINIGLQISGESVKYKNFTQVQVAVTGPSTTDVRQVPLGTDGKFFLDWNPSGDTGDFTVTVTSSDKKVKQSASFTVEAFDLPDYDEWPKENISETKEALEKLEEAVEKADEGLSTNDKEEMDKKLSEVTEKVNEVFLLFKDLGKANKEMMRLAKKEKKLPPNYAAYLAELNRSLSEQAKQMKNITESLDHKSQDNTICEHLVMVNEACAAFSTFTGAWSKVTKTIIANIMADKSIDAVNSPETPFKFFPKGVYNIYGTAKKDAEGIDTKLSKAGFVTDLAQYVSEVMLKKYCGVIKGEIRHDYTVNFRNANGVSWWKYGADMQGALVLRYPKEGSKGKIIKMKGSIEGNATKFSFYQNVEANDDFREGTQGKIEVVELRVLKPATVPFVSSLNDPAGFGAVARGLTPASFYITVDAEYDVDAKKLKLFFNNALIDFTDAVNNQLIFLEVGADLLPYIKKMTFPISKVFTTLGSVVRSNNEFDVVNDKKGNLTFSRQINTSVISRLKSNMI